MQYLLHTSLEHESKLALAIRVLICETRKLRHAQVTATVQCNGWLAAQQLKMPTCTQLHAQGQTITVLKCPKPDDNIRNREIKTQTAALLQGLHPQHERVKSNPFFHLPQPKWLCEQ